MIPLSNEMKAMLDDAVRDNKQILITGGMCCRKKLIQDYLFMKSWPQGRVAFVTKDGIRPSEPADYEEIESKLNK